MYMNHGRICEYNSNDYCNPRNTHWFFSFRYVQMRDAGLYECQVSTEPKLSHTFHLNVVGMCRFQSKCVKLLTTQRFGWPNDCMCNNHINILHCRTKSDHPW